MKKILVVDDQEEIRKILFLLFEGKYIVTTAANGQEGLALVDADRFDLVITDYQMPYLDGGHLARKIRAAAPTVPIVMVSGDNEQYLQGFVKAGIVDEVVTKPFSIDQLCTVADRYLEPPVVN